jgi:hypothetical protein
MSNWLLVIWGAEILLTCLCNLPQCLTSIGVNEYPLESNWTDI